MFSRSYATDTQTKSADLATVVAGAASPPQIVTACAEVEAFLHKYTADQTRWFFSITFPTLICKIFGFDDAPQAAAQKPVSPSGWIDIASLSNDSELAGRIFSLLSPNGVLLSSIADADALSLVKYVFPVERLPEWARYLLQSERDAGILADLCPLFKNRLKEDSIKGSSFQVQLNIFEYYMFWFAYYPVCRGNSEGPQTVGVRRSKRFRLENWAYSIPGLLSTKHTTEKKNEGNLYMRLLYAYLRVYVPMHDTQQPYRSSLLHYSSAYDVCIVERAEFLVNTMIHFWLVDNDFSPLPVTMCKSFGVSLPFRSFLGETPPTSGLGEVVNVFVKYLNLNSLKLTDENGQVDYVESPRQRLSGSVSTAKSRDAAFRVQTVSSWDSWIQRPLYRFILRTFLYCPVECSVKNVSQVFTLWVNYLEPWTISLEQFAELDTCLGLPAKIMQKDTQSFPCKYSSAWRGFVLANYLFYSSLVMHFIGFAHKFLHTDPELTVQMVSKVINILTSSAELMDLIKNVDIVFHSKPYGSSKSLLNTLNRFVPAIREQLQDWEDGLCESDADGSFLHENWNKDLRLFSDNEDGGLELLQLFVLRAESELQAVGGDNLARNLECLNTLKSQLGVLCGCPILKSISRPETKMSEHSRDEIFKPRSFLNQTVTDIKYRGDWMKRPTSSDEIAWLAKLLVKLSGWINESLGLNTVNSSHESPACSYVELSSDAGNVYGLAETTKVVLCSLLSWLGTLHCAGVKFMQKHGLRVNLRMLALKKVVMMMLIIAGLCALKRAFAASTSVHIRA